MAVVTDKAKIININVNKFRDFLKKTQPQNHPIKNHPVAECDEHIKELYFDMLSVFAMYENDDTENQNRYIQRLMAGCNDTLTITEHIKRAMEISVEKMAEFIKQIPEHNLTDRFFMDILIISCANGSPNKKQTEFLAEIADALGLTKDRIKHLCECTVAVLEQDFSKYTQISRDYNEKSKELNQYYYSPVIADTPLFDEYKEFKNLECVDDLDSIVKEFKNLDSIVKEFKNLDSIVIENMRINKLLKFTAVKTVTLKGCIFENIDYYYAVYFNGVQNAIIENCIFQNLKSVFCFESKETEMTVSNSSFLNCSFSTDKYYFGTIIHSTNNNEVTFDKCVFKNIHAGGCFTPCAISYHNQVTANNCELYNCTGKRFKRL